MARPLLSTSTRLSNSRVCIGVLAFATAFGASAVGANGCGGTATPAIDPAAPDASAPASGPATSPASDGGSTGAADGSASMGCQAQGPASLREVASMGPANDPCRAWAESVRGRVGRAAVGSFAVWTKRTIAGLPLVVGAMHTLGRGAAAPNGTAAVERLAPPEEEGAIRLMLVPPSGTLTGMERAVAFRFFHTSISANENAHPYARLRPRHDFFVDVMDAQRFATGELNEPLPDSLRHGVPVPLYDPDGLTTTTPTFGSPKAGDMLAYAGFPAAGPLAKDGAVGFGAMLTDEEAVQAIAHLSTAGDDEGTIAYDPEAEMLIAGEGFVGMSGGGVFDGAGRLAGVLVRASIKPGTKYLRAVRLSFIAASMEQARARLSAAESAAVGPFLPSP